MEAKAILITGGAGFIGVHATSHFLQKGWTVTILDNLSRRGVELNVAYLHAQFPGRVIIVKDDVRTGTETLQRLANKHDVILHLAAQVAVTTSVTNPREDFAINALGTFNVLEAARLSARQPIVLYASTNKVYGGLEGRTVEEGPESYRFADGAEGVAETEPLDFHSPYGCSKGAADQYVRDYARLYGLRTVVFRQSCIYGPRQFGVEDQGWVAWFLIAGMLNRPIQIYGNGKQVRDLLFVKDLVDCYDRAIAHIDITAGQIYNLGGGTSNKLSLLQFLAFLRDELHLNLSHTFSDWRPGDQPIFVSDNAKALRDMGWQPTVNLRDGFHQLHAWLQENQADIETFYRQ